VLTLREASEEYLFFMVFHKLLKKGTCVVSLKKNIYIFWRTGTLEMLQWLLGNLHSSVVGEGGIWSMSRGVTENIYWGLVVKKSLLYHSKMFIFYSEEDNEKYWTVWAGDKMIDWHFRLKKCQWCKKYLCKMVGLAMGTWGSVTDDN
jgi:hypothetical protein